MSLPQFVGPVRAYTYKVTAAPANSPVSLALAKQHMKLPAAVSSEDNLIQIYIDAATAYAEKLMRKDLITRTYETFRDFFPGTINRSGTFSLVQFFNTGNVGFELRRSPLQSVESVEYIKQDALGVFTTVDPTTFYNTVETDYSEVLTFDNSSWPDDAKHRLQAIKITFKTGFGDTDADIPQDIVDAILQHVLALFQNRGDCDTAVCSSSQCSGALPAASRMTYLQYRVENL